MKEKLYGGGRHCGKKALLTHILVEKIINAEVSYEDFITIAGPDKVSTKQVKQWLKELNCESDIDNIC